MSDSADGEKPANIHVAKPNTERPESGDDSDDESEVLEESPCGRWQKRREEVEQRDVPGIDNAFLAMDTEEGVEVVWNEVQFSEKKNFRAQQSFFYLLRGLFLWLCSLIGIVQAVRHDKAACTFCKDGKIIHDLDKIKQVFDNLIQLDHPNIVKFHKYWADAKGDKPRVIFITEYMSSGSLKQFLKKTKKNNKTFPLKTWKLWCTQILSALSYLHSCDPPIIHGNLSCDTIFIQHNGLIKIGSVAPDAIDLHVKTCRENIKNIHCIAPEYGGNSPVTTKVDMYAFGMCALEMAALGIQGNGDGNFVTEEDIQATLESLDNPMQKNFLEWCIDRDHKKRPTARDLLFHAVLFEVHPLKLLAAHKFVKSPMYLQGNLTDENYLGRVDPNKTVAYIPSQSGVSLERKFSQVPALELEKFLEDVKNGIYPLTAFAMMQPPPSRPRAITPELAESVKSETPEHYDVETRVVTAMSCTLRPPSEEGKTHTLILNLRMDDKMNRQLQTDLTEDLNGQNMSEELVHYGFINELDRDKVAQLIQDSLTTPRIDMNGVGADHVLIPMAITAS